MPGNEVVKSVDEFFGFSKLGENEYGKINSNLSSSISFTLPGGETVKTDGYTLIYYLLKQAEMLSTELPNRRRKINSVLRQFKDYVISNIDEIDSSSPKLSRALLSASLQLSFVEKARTPPSLESISSALSIEEHVNRIKDSFREVSPQSKKAKKLLDNLLNENQHRESIRDMELNLFTNYAFLSSLPMFAGDDEGLSKYMREIGFVMTSSMLFYKVVSDLVSSGEIKMSGALELVSEVNYLIARSSYIGLEGEAVADAINQLTLEVLRNPRDALNSLPSFREALGESFLLYNSEIENIDFSEVHVDKSFMLSVLFTPTELKQGGYSRELEVLEEVDNYLSTNLGVNLYDLYIGGQDSEQKLEQSINNQKIFEGKGYSKREKLLLFKSMVFDAVRSYYLSNSTNFEQYFSSYVNEFTSNLPTKKEVEQAVKSDLNEMKEIRGVKAPASQFLSVPLNVVNRAVVMLQENSQKRFERKEVIETSSVSLKASRKVSVYFSSLKKTKTLPLFDLNEENLRYLTPFNKTVFDEVKINVNRVTRGRETTQTLELNNTTLPVAAYLSHVLNDIYSRSRKFSTLIKSKGVKGLSHYISVSYSAKSPEHKKKISLVSNKIDSIVNVDSLIQDIGNTELGKRLEMFADAFANSVSSLENINDPETIRDLRSAAYLSFLKTIIYEFNLTEHFLGKEVKDLEYQDILEIADRLDQFLSQGVEMEFNEEFLLKNLKIGSGVNMLGFRGGTSLWILREDGSKELIAYTTPKGIKVVNPLIRINNSDNIVLRYHSQKDVGKLGDPWLDGRIYAHSTAFRFLTHNFHLLSEKTLYEIGMNTSSTLVQGLDATKREIRAEAIPLAVKLRSPSIYLPEPESPPLLLPMQETVSLTSMKEVEIAREIIERKLGIKFFSEGQQANFVATDANLEDFRSLLKFISGKDIDIKAPTTNEVVQRAIEGLVGNPSGGTLTFDQITPEFRDMLIKVTNEILNNPNSSVELQVGNFGIRFSPTESGESYKIIIHKNGRVYITGEVSKEDLVRIVKGKEKKLEVEKYSPKALVLLPRLFTLEGGRTSFNVGLNTILYQGEKSKNIKAVASPTAMASFSLFRGLSLFGGAIFNPSNLTQALYGKKLSKLAYSALPLAGLSYNKYLANGDKFGTRIQVSGGASIQKFLFGNVDLTLRLGKFTLDLGVSSFAKGLTKKVGIGIDRDKDGISDYGVGVYSMAGIPLPYLIVNEKNLAVEATKIAFKGLKYAAKPFKKLWDWTFGSIFKKKPKKQDKSKEAQDLYEQIKDRVMQ